MSSKFSSDFFVRDRRESITVIDLTDSNDIKPNLGDGLESLESNKLGCMGTPSPPKKPRMMIGVNKPSTSTPRTTLPYNVNLSPVTPHISRIESLSTVNERCTNLSTESPHQDGYDSDKTIPYNVNTSFSDESTVPFSPNKKIKSESDVNIEEILVINDPLNFVDTVMSSFGWDTNNKESEASTLKVNTTHGTAAKRLDFSGIVGNNHETPNTKEKQKSTSIENTADTTKTSTKKQRKPRIPKTSGGKEDIENGAITESNISTKKVQRKRKTATEKKLEDLQSERTVKEIFSPNQNVIITPSKSVIHQAVPPGSGAVITSKNIAKNTQTLNHIPQNSRDASFGTSQNPSKNMPLTPGGSGVNGIRIIDEKVIRKGTNSTPSKQSKNLDIINKLKDNKEIIVTVQKTGSVKKVTQNSSKAATPSESVSGTIQSQPQTTMKDEKKTPQKGNPRKMVADKQQPCCSKSLNKKTSTVVKTNASSASIDATIDDVVNAYMRTNDTTTPEKPSSVNIDSTINGVVNAYMRTSNTTAPKKSSSVNLDSTKNTTSPAKTSAAKVVSNKNEALTTTSKNITATPEKQKNSLSVASPLKAGSPRKRLFGSPGKGSPKKNHEIKSFKSKEGKQLQVKQLEELVKLFKEVARNRHLSALLDQKEYSILSRFVKNMAENQKYVVMKLFVWKKLFYNTVTFCKKAQMEVDDKDIHDIFEYLREEEFVEADYKASSASMNELLENLDITKVKEIMTELKIKPKKNKAENISKLLTLANTQTTLTFAKSLKDLVMDEIEKKLGFAIKIKQEVHDTFYNACFLATFTNPDFVDVQVYFNNIIHQNVVFPQAAVEDYPVFYSRDKFRSFCRAVRMKRELDELLRDKKKEHRPVGIHSIGEKAYGELYNLVGENIQDDHIQAPHLKRFTAQHVYCKILSTCCQHIFTKQNGFPQDVRKWLNFLISHFPKSKRLGEYYNRLIKLHMRHLNEIDYELAAKLLIEALDTKRQVLGERAKYDLGALGQKIKSSKKHKIDQLYHDRIVQLIPRDIDTKKFPQNQIDAQCIRSDESGKKRVYINKNVDETDLKHVEQVALDHYLENGYVDGRKCEGALIKALLALFFWDIIYNPKTTIPGTFISKIQTAPLDMFSAYFYPNRRDLIDERLREIDHLWPESKVIEFAAHNWQIHSHEKSCFGEIKNFIDDILLVEVLITSINRKVLAKIFERLIKNLGEFSSGMPDLMVWNVDEKKCKFVEVKGEGDRLQTNQKLWIEYLMEIGASVEVCWVHSMGSKRKKIKKVQVENNEAGPSNRPDK